MYYRRDGKPSTLGNLNQLSQLKTAQIFTSLIDMLQKKKIAHFVNIFLSAILAMTDPQVVVSLSTLMDPQLWILIF